MGCFAFLSLINLTSLICENNEDKRSNKSFLEELTVDEILYLSSIKRKNSNFFLAILNDIIAWRGTNEGFVSGKWKMMSQGQHWYLNTKLIEADILVRKHFQTFYQESNCLHWSRPHKLPYCWYKPAVVLFDTHG